MRIRRTVFGQLFVRSFPLALALLYTGCGDAMLSPIDASAADSTGGLIAPLDAESVHWLERPLPGHPKQFIRIALADEFTWKLPPVFDGDAESLTWTALTPDRHASDERAVWQLNVEYSQPGGDPRPASQLSENFVLLSQRTALLAGLPARYERYANPASGEIRVIWSSGDLTVTATLRASGGMSGTERTDALLETIRAIVKSISLRSFALESTAAEEQLEAFLSGNPESRSPVSLATRPPLEERRFEMQMPAGWAHRIDDEDEMRLELFQESSGGRPILIELHLGQRSLTESEDPDEIVRELLMSSQADWRVLSAEPVFFGGEPGVTASITGVTEIDEEPQRYMLRRWEVRRSGWTFEMIAVIFADILDTGLENDFNDHTPLFQAIASTFRVVEAPE